ncbi:MAG: hypothetical protein V5A68_01925 [Candidatus Thermoplasmatota archaeon]
MNKKIFLPEEIAKQIDEIKNDNQSGSVKLTKKAADTIIDATQKCKKDTIKDCIKKTGYRLIDAQPSMAAIFNLVNQTLIILEKIDKKEIKKTISQNTNRYIEKLDSNLLKICKNASSIINDGSTIATYSYSGTVLESILKAKEDGKKFKVICSESRPINEGLNLAKKLDEKNIKIKYMTDAALFSYIKNADLILVGADSISINGFVNKIGTETLAISAKEYQKNFYILSSTEKIIPKKYTLRKEKNKDPDEILKDNNLKNAEIINQYFQTIPLKYADFFITEHGLWKKNTIKNYIEKLKLHPYLKQK